MARHHSRLRGAIITAVVATWLSGPAAQTPSGVQVFPVQGDVSLLVGPDGLDDLGANITVQTSDDGLVVVDTGNGEATEQILAAIRSISTRPIRFVINTRAAAAHTGGNAGVAGAGRAYGGRAAGDGELMLQPGEGAIIIAHEEVSLELSGVGDSAAVPFAAWPSETYFSDTHETFNDEPVQLFHAPAAITSGDSIVFFRRSDVISTGDVFSTLTYPQIDVAAGGTIDGVIAALNHIVDLAVPREKQEGGTYIIPGHGRVADEADVVEYRDMLVIIRDRVQDLISRGQSLADVQAADVSFDYDRRYATPEWTDEQFVEAVFRSCCS